MLPQNQQVQPQPEAQFQFQPDAQPQPQQARPQVSRRGLLRGGLIGGGVGLAVAAGAGAALGLTGQTSLKPESKPVMMAPMTPDATKGPLVVYVSDTSAGVLDVYAGTGAIQIHNPALVTQILNNLK